MNEVRLLYVMGRGHSGSTVLDALLGNAPGVAGVGELVSGMLRFEDVCSCGETIENCDFWRAVRRRFEHEIPGTWTEAARAVQSQAHLSRFPATLFDGQGGRAALTASAAITAAIGKTAGASVVVDSSKEFTRALLLARHDAQSRIIHLVRSPHQVLASLEYRIGMGRGFKFLRRRYGSRALTPLYMGMAAAGWLVGNLLGELVRRMAPSRILRVRYEDLCTDYRGTLDAIARFVEVDLQPVAEAVAAGRRLPLFHKLAGNQMRTEGTFVFDPSRRESRSLSACYAILASLITWPLLLAYGYGLDGRPR